MSECNDTHAEMGASNDVDVTCGPKLLDLYNFVQAADFNFVAVVGKVEQNGHTVPVSDYGKYDVESIAVAAKDDPEAINYDYEPETKTFQNYSAYRDGALKLGVFSTPGRFDVDIILKN